jgi:hypothetical protein
VSAITPGKLGAVLGSLVMLGAVVWQRTRAPECTGALFIELRPPLTEPDLYRFRLQLDERTCELQVPLPPRGRIDTKACGGLTLALDTRVQGTATSIVGLTVGAAPEELRFEVRRRDELLYDARLKPAYGPYATRREDSRRFCGDRAHVKPQCVRGSSACEPFKPVCATPESCPKGKVCCLNVDWAREYGASAAAECSAPRYCLDRFGQIACSKDDQCPRDMRCGDASVARSFDPPLLVCQPQ